MVAGGFEPFYLRIFALDRAALRQTYLELPYRKLPGFRTLLTESRKATPPGARVALWLPSGRWESGYEYGYYRSVYLLAGREVLPLLDDSSRFLPANLAAADYVICWHCRPPFNGFEDILQTPDGVLARKR